MSSFGSIPSRVARPFAVVLAACVLALAGAGAALASDEPSTSPMASGAPASPPAGPSASPAASPDSMVFPLPGSVAVIPPDIPTVSIEPESEPGGLAVGETVPYSLPHCGLLSPIDLDGSLWQPVSGVDPSRGPIDSDDEVGELINATPGDFTLLSEDRAEWRSLTGLVVHFERAQGALDYPLCM